MQDRVAEPHSLPRDVAAPGIDTSIFARLFAARFDWTFLLSEDQPLLRRCIAALLLGLTGFAVAFCVHRISGVYFSSITIIAVILIALYGGLHLGSLSAVTLSLAADYCFIPPVGTVFDTPAGYEHFFIVTGLAMFAALVGSSLRAALRQAVLARQEAERVSALMEKVLALVAHDIRGPLSGIQMGCDFIARHPERTARHQSILAMMARSVGRADSMIGSLLDVARMRTGKSIPLSFQSGDLSAEVAHAIEEMALTGCDRLSLTACERIPGYWALGGIRRALENLVTNAAKYGAPDTPITIALRRQGDDALLSVHNYGQAISAADQTTLFDPFQQAEQTRARTARGWGLGLSLVKGVVEAHGGKICLKSDAETGTTFTLRLPIRTEHAVADAARRLNPDCRD